MNKRLRKEVRCGLCHANTELGGNRSIEVELGSSLPQRLGLSHRDLVIRDVARAEGSTSYFGITSLSRPNTEYAPKTHVNMDPFGGIELRPDFQLVHDAGGVNDVGILGLKAGNTL